MTKQQRSGSTWSLFRVCHALLGLCSLKIVIFVALAFGYTLPDMGIMSAITAQYEQILGLENSPSDNTLTAEVRPSHGVDSINAEQNPATPQGHAQNALQQDAMPQGSAAVRAALAYKADSRNNYADQLPNTVAEAPSLEPEIMRPRAEKPAKEDVSWWDNIRSMTSLPIPRLGVDQVAYAATIDTPLTVPPPPPPKTGTMSPFTPPTQILPAGTAGPQLTPSTTDNLLVPNSNPPAPQLDAYVPPEDPTRQQQELARREQEILMLKKQMEQRLAELQAAERKVQGMLKDAKEVEAEKVNTLISMYSNMKPRQAGAAMENMDENIAAKILVSMKPKQSGEILSYMNPIKTAKLTELLSRMRIEQ